MKAVICPVCNGMGKYEGRECHGCGGKGWVEVKDNPVYYPYYPYWPYTPPPTWQPYTVTWTGTTGET